MSTGGRVLHFGKYDGEEIDLIVETDPMYIIWAYENVKGHGISQAAYNDARHVLDRFRDDGDFDDEIPF